MQNETYALHLPYFQVDAMLFAYSKLKSLKIRAGSSRNSTINVPKLIMHIILTSNNLVCTESIEFNTLFKRFGERMLWIRSETESEIIQGYGLGFETTTSKGFGFDAKSKGLGQVYQRGAFMKLIQCVCLASNN